jgi:hypothetical protein
VSNSPHTELRSLYSFLDYTTEMGHLTFITFKFTILVCILGGPIQDDQELKPCPNIKPFTKVNIDQVNTLADN